VLFTTRLLRRSPRSRLFPYTTLFRSQGVRGRNSDNTRLREVLDWEPQISLEDGLARTYKWIENQVREKLEANPDAFQLRVKEARSEEHTSELQSRFDLVCRLLLEKKK